MKTTNKSVNPCPSGQAGVATSLKSINFIVNYFPMIRFASILVATILLAACNNKTQTQQTATAAPYNYSQLEGSYRGDFGGSGDILVVLRHVTDRSAVGFDLHKGLRRNIAGEFTPATNGFKFTMHEPGDNQYDGIFEFTLDTTKNSITGSWKPNNKATAKEASYVLQKQKGDKDIEEGSVTYSDSLGDLSFYSSGSCIYQYYPIDAQGKKAEQYQSVRGNWKKTDNAYIVYWQKNTVFPSNQSTFKFVKEGDDADEFVYRIAGEGREFYTGP